MKEFTLEFCDGGSSEKLVSCTNQCDRQTEDGQTDRFTNTFADARQKIASRQGNEKLIHHCRYAEKTNHELQSSRLSLPLEAVGQHASDLSQNAMMHLLVCADHSELSLQECSSYFA